MHVFFSISKPSRSGSALLLTMVLTGVALITAAAVLAYSASTARLNYRSNQYHCAVAAAEADTEKIVSMISKDYLNGGEAQVNANLGMYRQTILAGIDSAYWGDWEFNDA